MTTLLSIGLASPDAFNLLPVDSITSPADKDGEVEWSHAEIAVGFGWWPRVYDPWVVEELLGPPVQVAPDLKGWALAYSGFPDTGVVLVLSRDRVVPRRWTWGSLTLPHGFEAGREAYPLLAAWLNAFSVVHDQVAAGLAEH